MPLNIYKGTKFDVMFVKNGCYDGDPESPATYNDPSLSSLGRHLEDGWYYLLPDEDNAVGPHETEPGAADAARNQIDNILAVEEQHVLGGN